MSSVTDEFKAAMRRLATTIAIVTAGRGETCTGMAATAVMSVTADPPTLLIAVNRGASIAPLLAVEDTFCVNLLSERHRELVPIFSGAKKGLERFESGPWRLGDEHPPVLEDAIARLVCRKTNVFDVSTHQLYTGEVTHVVNHPDIDPLLWVDGRFASAAVLGG